MINLIACAKLDGFIDDADKEMVVFTAVRFFSIFYPKILRIFQ
jgi:hypothetical protein